ncbi:MAG: sulfatase-like hydrolase/transferase [Verrucomicrobiota bacterium]
MQVYVTCWRCFPQWLAAVLIPCSILVATAADLAKGGDPGKPNLLFVFSDQQSRDALGCYDNPDVMTPQLDKLAAHGTLFEHGVSSCPVCTPMRGMLFSGQHPLRNGAIHNDIPLLADNGEYFGHVLKFAGYHTGYIGKWHLLGGDRDRPVPPGPMRYGFDEVFLTDNCHVDYRPGQAYYWNEQGEKVFFKEWEVYGQARQAMQFLDQCPSNQPFALFVSFHPPHDIGWQKEEPGVRNYDTEPELMRLYNPARLKLRPSVKDSPGVRRAYQGYYAMSSGVDKAFGWLMDKLVERGLQTNTLVVFTSDHGDNLMSYGYTLCKDVPENTAVRVPLLMRWPAKLLPSSVSQLPMGTLDLMPTILGLMKLPIPSTCEGRNLSQAIIKGDDNAVSSVPLFFVSPSNWRGVYTREYTYAVGEVEMLVRDDAGQWQMKVQPIQRLYDKKKDPFQLTNFYDDPNYAVIQRKLDEETYAWMKRFKDPMADGRQLKSQYGDGQGKFPLSTLAPEFQGRPVDFANKIVSREDMPFSQ